MSNKLTEREHAIMNEAFMVGRIYNKQGEPEKPSEIHEKLIGQCLLKANAVKNPMTNINVDCINYDTPQKCDGDCNRTWTSLYVFPNGRFCPECKSQGINVDLDGIIRDGLSKGYANQTPIGDVIKNCMTAAIRADREGKTNEGNDIAVIEEYWESSEEWIPICWIGSDRDEGEIDTSGENKTRIRYLKSKPC